MNTLRSWRENVPLTYVALAVLAVLVFRVFLIGFLGGHASSCGFATSGELAGWAVCGRLTAPGTEDLHGYLDLLLGASAIVAMTVATYAARRGRTRLDLLAFVGWTTGFWYFASTPNYALSDRICIAGLNPGFIEQEPLGQCFVPWAPGWDRMAIWLLVSLAILVPGYVLRGLGSRRREPVTA